LAEEVTVLLAEQARRGGNRFGSFIRPDVPHFLLSDPTRVRQVLLNFCSNALKFTEAGEVFLHAEVVLGEPPLMRFEVRDTGCGIAPEVQAHLFDAFSQADGTITRRFGGTGLGLAISKRLVKLMGGEIGVTSAVGVGSTFWFTVPLVGARCELQSRRGFGALRPRILCLSPCETTRAALTAHLEAAGADVRAQGPECALPGPAVAPDLLVVEDLEAFADLDAWRARNASVPLVLLNPLASPLTPQAKRELGVAAVLSTPLRASQLVTSLRGVLLEQEPGAPLPGSRGPERRESNANTRTLRVLLVEDNAVNQRVALAMLAGMDCAVDVADNGRLGVEAARAASYDLILMDCQMPEMTGYEATALLRTEETYPPRYIVALTADVMAPDRERCLAAGMDAYVSKPVRRETLRAVVEARRHALESGAARPA
ncbi:MAG: response regulator, partial [Planctomycetes bacterium]|nr:response regulator [Planctomycetota bacterium]